MIPIKILLDYSLEILFYVAGFVGGIGFGFLLGLWFSDRKAAAPGLPMSVPPPMPERRACVPSCKGKLPPPARPRLFPDRPEPSGNRSFNEGKKGANFGNETPEQYNG